MKITIEHDDGRVESFQYITDLYIAYRQKEPVFMWESLDKVVDFDIKTRSNSWGANVRELVKEVQQSLFELQDYLRGLRNGGSG